MLNVNYGTGAGNYTSNLELNDLIEEINANLTYTQTGVSIEDNDNNTIAYSTWYGTTPTEEDIVTVQFGDFGFYGEWVIV